MAKKESLKATARNAEPYRTALKRITERHVEVREQQGDPVDVLEFQCGFAYGVAWARRQAEENRLKPTSPAARNIGKDVAL